MDTVKTIMNSETFISASNDVLKIGALLLGGRLMSSGSITDQGWMRSTALLLIGFVIYHIIVRNIINPSDFVDMTTIRMAIDDIIKFGLAFIFARLLSTKEIASLTDRSWISQTSIILAGFAIYDIIFFKLIRRIGTFSVFGYTLYTISDVFKFGTMLVVSRYFSGETLNDPTWLKEVAGALIGVGLYDILSQRRFRASVSIE